MTDWKSDLSETFHEAEKRRADTLEKLAEAESELDPFFSNVAAPALEELRQEFQRHQIKASITQIEALPHQISILLWLRGHVNFIYTICVRRGASAVSPIAKIGLRWDEQADKDGDFIESEDDLLRVANRTAIKDLTKDDIIADFLSHYKGFLYVRSVS